MVKLIRRVRRLHAASALAVLTLVQLGAAGTARAATYEVYSLTGYEVWYSPTVATFVGTGRGDAGELSAWHSTIAHSEVISPTGTVTGGSATLYRADGVQMTGYFGGGAVELAHDGPDCTNEVHNVTGMLYGATRTDSTAVGAGLFEATLVHHRAWLFGRCLTYSASVTGTISMFFEPS